MANKPLNSATAAESVPYWRAPQVLLEAAVRSSSLLPHDLVNRFTVERFQLFLTGYLAMYGGAGVLLPLWEYMWVLRSAWFLAIAAICTGQCLVLAVALALARRRRHAQAITVACIGNWAAVLLITLVAPHLLPVMVLATLVPVVFAQPYIRWQRGLVFAGITAGCVLMLAVVARFQHFVHLAAEPPRWIENAFILVALPCRSRCSPSVPPKSMRRDAAWSRPPTRNGAASSAICMTVPSSISSHWRCSSSSPATLSTPNLSRC
jgi:hypothetical protein